MYRALAIAEMEAGLRGETLSAKSYAAAARTASRSVAFADEEGQADPDELDEDLMDDDEGFGVFVPQPELTVMKGGAADFISVRLAAEPERNGSARVVVAMGDGEALLHVMPRVLSFTRANWSDPQVVRVEAFKDTGVAGGRDVLVRLCAEARSRQRRREPRELARVVVRIVDDEARFLYTFGMGADGRLGHGNQRIHDTPTRVDALSSGRSADYDSGSSLVAVAAGQMHMGALTARGQVLVWGSNCKGQLGTGDERSHDAPAELPLDAFSKYKVVITQLDCGMEHTAAVSAHHKLYTWGCNQYGQLGVGTEARVVSRPVGLSSRQFDGGVAAVSCGAQHTVVLSHEHGVFAMGYNQAGQLGLGHRKQSVKEPAAWSSATPTKVAGLAAVTVVQVAAGNNHTAALDAAGTVYTWGCGGHGRLGVGDTETYARPQVVRTLRDAGVHVRQLSCGGAHTGVLTAGKDVYAWGNASFGQLGVGDRRHRTLPTLVRALSGKGVCSVDLGQWHSMALTELGTVYSWGFGEEGALGVCQLVSHSATPVLNEALYGLEAMHVAAGWGHSCVLTARRVPSEQMVRRLRSPSRSPSPSAVVRSPSPSPSPEAPSRKQGKGNKKKKKNKPRPPLHAPLRPVAKVVDRADRERSPSPPRRAAAAAAPRSPPGAGRGSPRFTRRYASKLFQMRAPELKLTHDVHAPVIVGGSAELASVLRSLSVPGLPASPGSPDPASSPTRQQALEAAAEELFGEDGPDELALAPQLAPPIGLMQRPLHKLQEPVSGFRA